MTGLARAQFGSRIRRLIDFVGLAGTLVLLLFVAQTPPQRAADMGGGERRIAPGARLTVTADGRCSARRTTSGAMARAGIARAASELLPIGSVIRIASAGEHDGIYTVMDDGPEGQGGALDILFRSCAMASQFGRRQIEIQILRLGWQPLRSAPSS